MDRKERQLKSASLRRGQSFHQWSRPVFLLLFVFFAFENSYSQCSASLHGPVSPLCSGATGTIVLQGPMTTSSSYQLYYTNGTPIGSSVPGSASDVLQWPGMGVGSYQVKGTGGPCSTFVSNTVTVTAGSSGSISIGTGGVSPVMCIGNSITLSPQGGSGYSWTSSPTDGAANGSGAITVTPSVNTTYTLHGTESTCGTSVTSSITVQVSPKVSQVTLTPSSSAFCQGAVAQTTFTANATNASSYGGWSLTSGAGTYTTTSNTCTVTWSTSFTGTATVNVTAYSGGSCSYTTAVSSSVTINPLTSPPTVSNMSIGYNTTAVLSASGAGANETYKWYNNNSSFSGFVCQGSCSTPALTSSTTYYVAKYNTSTGCETTPAQRSPLTVTLQCNSSPALNGSNTISICPGATGTLTLQGVDASTSFQLYYSSGSTIGSPQTNPSFIQWAGLGVGSYYVKGSTGLCSSYTSPTVTVVAVSTGSISIGTGGVSPVMCIGNSITLSPQGGSGYSWTSSPTDGAANGSGAITVTPSVNTTYTLHGTESTCSTSVTSSITVQVSPKVSQVTLTPSSSAFCQGAVAQTTFTANATNASSYGWSLTSGAGTYTTTSNTCTVTWSTSFTGTATVNVTAYSGGSCSYTTAVSSSVTINPLTSPPTVSNMSIGYNTTAVLSASGAGANETYKWYYGNSSGSGTVCPSPGSSCSTPALTSSTTYYVAKYNTSTGCETTPAQRSPLTVTLQCNSSPALNGSNTISICPGATGTLTLQGVDASTSFQLYYSSGSTIGSPQTNPSFIQWAGLGVGSYYVKGSTGLCSSYTSPTVTVVAVSTGSISIGTGGVSPVMCIGNSITLSPQGGSGYSWTSSPTDGAANGSGAITVTPSVNTTYTLHGTESTCSTSVTSSITVQVSPKVSQVTLTPSSSAFCQGAVAQTTFTANATNASSYGWSLTSGAGTYTTTSNTCTVTWSTSFTGTATVNVTAYSGGSCSYTTAVSSSVTINPLTSPPTVSNMSIGYNTTAVLSASGAGANETYKWYYGNSSGSGTVCPSPGSSCSTPALTSSTTYYVAKYNTSTGCETTPAQRSPLTVTLQCNSSPALNGSNTISICPGATGTLTLQGVDASTSFQLYYSSGSTIGSPQTNPSFIQWAGLGVGSYYVKGSTGLCSSYTSPTVTVVAVSTGSISIGTGGVSPVMCIGNSITLSPQGGSGYSWTSSPTDGAANGSGAITVTPSVNTTYTLHGTESTCSTSVTSSITVQVSPKVSQVTLTPSSSAFCQGAVAQTTFTANATNASSYGWSLTSGAGTYTTTSNTCTVTWSTSFTGTATVNVTAYSGGSCSYTTAVSSSVTINPLTSPPTVSNMSIGYNTTAVLSASGAGANETYKWYYGNSSGSGTVCPSPGSSCSTPALTSSTTYYVAKYNTSTGCETTPAQRSPLTVTLQCNSSPALNGSNTISICPGATGTLTLQGVDASTSFQLYYSSGSTIGSPQTNPSFIQWAGLGVGSYYVKGSTGLCSSYTSPTVTVVAVSTGSISIGTGGVSPVMCIGNSITLSPQGGSGYSWTSSPTDGAANGSGAITVTPSVNTTYTLHGTESTCSTSVTSSITVQVSPKVSQVTLTPSSSAFCQGAVAQTTFTANATDASSYGWSLTSGAGTYTTTSNTCTVTWNTSFTGTATVNVTAYSGGSCSYTLPASSSVIITVDQPPIANAGPDQNVQLGNGTSQVVLSGSGTDADGTLTSYNWSQVSGPTVTIPNDTQPSVTLNKLNAGNYVFRLTVTDNCFPASDDVAVTITFPPNNFNWIKESVVQVDGKLTASDLVGLPVDQMNVHTTYIDGLGRPMQSIGVQASPNKLDIVQPIIYDPFGREAKKYLPFTVQNNGHYNPNEQLVDAVSGNYIGAAQTFYLSTTKVVSDTRPFSETVFEPSPLNRPTKDYGPGVGWNNINVIPSPTIIVDKPVQHKYLINTANEVLLFTYDPATGLVSTGLNSQPGYYDQGQLLANVTTDEHGNDVIEYVDKLGHIVCKKVLYATDDQNNKLYASTYYIYDDFNNLVVVLPPQAVKTALTTLSQN